MARQLFVTLAIVALAAIASATPTATCTKADLNTYLGTACSPLSCSLQCQGAFHAYVSSSPTCLSELLAEGLSNTFITYMSTTCKYILSPAELCSNTGFTASLFVSVYQAQCQNYFNGVASSCPINCRHLVADAKRIQDYSSSCASAIDSVLTSSPPVSFSYLLAKNTASTCQVPTPTAISGYFDVFQSRRTLEKGYLDNSIVFSRPAANTVSARKDCVFIYASGSNSYPSTGYTVIDGRGEEYCCGQEGSVNVLDANSSTCDYRSTTPGNCEAGSFARGFFYSGSTCWGSCFLATSSSY